MPNIARAYTSQAYLTRALGRPAGWRDSFRHVLAFASTIHDRVYLLNDRFDLFDIEIVFLVPWTLVYREFVRDLGMASALLPALFFGGVLVVGLVYELRKGGLKWER